jgi:hypothetical protein
MARAIALKSKAGYTCAVVPQSRSDEMLAKREESIYGNKGVRCPQSPKPNILTVTCCRNEGRWIKKEVTILPSEGPSVWVGVTATP